MSLKVISKNNVGAAATLILTILLSQARFFDFLIDTFLGRMILLLFVLGISYTNKIIGVVAVLIVVIMFNQSNIGLMEGFTSDETEPSKDSNTESSANAIKIKQMSEQIKSSEDDLNKKKDKLKQMMTDKKNSDSESTSSSSSAKIMGGREGFNNIDRESSILKGKNSNEVPVFLDARKQQDDVEAADKGMFSSGYASV
jgi:hypothetical protein